MDKPPVTQEATPNQQTQTKPTTQQLDSRLRGSEKNPDEQRTITSAPEPPKAPGSLLPTDEHAPSMDVEEEAPKTEKKTTDQKSQTETETETTTKQTTDDTRDQESVDEGEGPQPSWKMVSRARADSKKIPTELKYTINFGRREVVTFGVSPESRYVLGMYSSSAKCVAATQPFVFCPLSIVIPFFFVEFPVIFFFHSRFFFFFWFFQFCVITS